MNWWFFQTYMIAEIAKKKTGRNSESHGACREQGDLNSWLLTIGTRGCKVTRARLQELTHGARLSVVGGTPQNPWGKWRLRSRHRLFLTRPSQIRSKSTDAVVLGREFTPMCEKWETPFPGPSFLILPSFVGKAANPWAAANTRCRWGPERRSSAPGGAAAAIPNPEKQPGEEQENGGGHCPMVRAPCLPSAEPWSEQSLGPSTALQKLGSFKQQVRAENRWGEAGRRTGAWNETHSWSSTERGLKTQNQTEVALSNSTPGIWSFCCTVSNHSNNKSQTQPSS